MNRFILIISLNVLITIGFAQPTAYSPDLDAIAPKTVPNIAPPATMPDAPLPEITASKENIISELKKIIFINTSTVTQASLNSNSDSIVLRGVNPPNLFLFHALIQDYINQPASMYSLEEMLQQIILHYRKNDLPVVDTFIPEQTMKNGTLYISIIEGKLGKLKIEGNEFFPTEIFEKNFTLKSGDPIRKSQAIKDANWINKNPFRQAEIVFEEGANQGTTDVTLKVQDLKPVRMYTGFDNTGNDLTGDERLSFGLNWGNALNRDHQLSYQYMTALHPEWLRSHSGSYTIPILPFQHMLTFILSYATNGADFPDPTQEIDGSSWSIGGRYSIDLPDFKPLPNYSQNLTLGYDFKRSDNMLMVNKIVASDSKTDTSQFSFAYTGVIPDPFGSTSFSATLVASPGGMTGHNGSKDLRASGAGGASYFYGRVSLNRVTPLPNKFVWTIKSSAQISDRNLLGGEQLGAGGFSTVRGYDEREANGDQGFLISTEITTPPINPSELLNLIKLPGDQIQFLGFLDYGTLGVKHKSTSSINPSNSLLSAGYGFRYMMSTFLTFRFDHGFQLKDTAQSDLTRRTYNNRSHFALMLSY